MDLSKQIENKIDSVTIEREIEQMESTQKKLKNQRNLSLASIRTGELIALGSLVTTPLGGWIVGLATLIMGGIFYGAGRIADRKIVDKYNETTANLSSKRMALYDKRLENDRAKNKDANVKVENKIVATKTIEDEIKEA